MTLPATQHKCAGEKGQVTLYTPSKVKGCLCHWEIPPATISFLHTRTHSTQPVESQESILSCGLPCPLSTNHKMGTGRFTLGSKGGMSHLTLPADPFLEDALD